MKRVVAPFLPGGSANSKSGRQEDLWALRDVSFEVEQGQTVGIIGRNGAGKSTLLKILSRITEPTQGRVTLKGRVASLLEVGTGFHPELTGRENIYLNGAILGMTKAEIRSKFDEIVDFAEVEKFLDTPVKRYSSGMYVRLAFAVAAHLEPEILLVDEVLAVGDAHFQKKCLGKMGRVSKEGRTVVFVSHQLDMIRSLCSCSILLDDGALRIIGPTSETIDHYLSSLNGHIEAAPQFSVVPNPGLPIEIVGGRMVDVLGGTRSEYDLHEPVVLELRHIVRNQLTGSIVKVEVKDRDSEKVLFWSFDTDTNPKLLDSRIPGVYESRIEFPCPLLKEGEYLISVGVGIANSEAIQDIRDCLTFSVVLRTAPSAFLGYAKKRPGILAVSGKWTTRTSQ